MDDFERYGDYNEIEEDNPPRKNILGIIFKIVAAVIIVAVIGVVGARLFTFNYYPDSMKRLYFDDKLTAYYLHTGGDIGAITQKMRAPYDDADLGNFFCDNLIVIPELGQLQVSVRYNESLATSFDENYGIKDFDIEDSSQFSFRLWRDGEGEARIGELDASYWDSFMMYRYCKLVFNGVDFSKEADVKWIRLEILVDGIDEPFMVAIYENNDSYSAFTDYELSKGEEPK